MGVNAVKQGVTFAARLPVTKCHLTNFKVDPMTGFNMLQIVALRQKILKYH